MLVGSDRCEDPNGCKDRQGNLNDVTILLHVAQDQSNAVAVSFPRDLVVPIPSCPQPNGGSSYAMSAQPLYVTLFYGGLACTVLTVSKLTGLDVQFAAEVTFSGVARISSAIGGVDVCVNGPLIDSYSGIRLPKAGTYSLSGAEEAAAGSGHVRSVPGCDRAARGLSGQGNADRLCGERSVCEDSGR